MRFDSKQELLSIIEHEYATLHDLLRRTPRERYAETGVWGDSWTLNDLIAHLAEWQRMFLRWYREGLEGTQPNMPAPGYKWNETPRLNHDIWKRHRDRSYEAVMMDLEQSHDEIVAVVKSLDADALLKPGRFAWTGKYPLTTYLGPNTASHYRFATRVIKRWLRQQADSKSAGS